MGREKQLLISILLTFVLLGNVQSEETYVPTPEAVKIINEVEEKISTLPEIFPEAIANELILRCQKALSIDKNYVDAYVYLALSYFLINAYDQAIETINKVMDFQDSHPDVYFVRGSLFYLKSTENVSFIEKAIADFQKVLSLSPQYESPVISRESIKAPEIMFTISHCYVTLGKLEEAEKTLQKIIRKYPDTQWEQTAKVMIDAKRKR